MNIIHAPITPMREPLLPTPMASGASMQLVMQKHDYKEYPFAAIIYT